MDARFLEYYNRELSYMRELGAEFARANPKVASRLGMQGGGAEDPYVERLLEGFCFLTARVQLKMDAEFPRFSERLLDVVYPNHLAPIPSMAIAQFHVDSRESALTRGQIVPAGTALYRRLEDVAATCEFRTAHPVTLWPIALGGVRMTGMPADLPDAGQAIRARARSTIRIAIDAQQHVPLNQLPLDRLDLHLAGPDAQAGRLLELLTTRALTIGCRDTVSGQWLAWLDAKTSIEHNGFSAEQAMLPSDARTFEGHRLLQEYFAFPARFHFLSIGGLKRAFASATGTRLELVILLDEADGDLERSIDTNHVKLHCTPIVNLFSKVTDRVPVTPRDAEYRLVVDRTRPLDYEIYAVQRVIGHRLGDEGDVAFLPFFASSGPADHDGEAYFSVRRERRLIGAQSARHAAGADYTGADSYISLVDRRHAPFDERIELLSANVLCTNSDLPLWVTSGTRSDLTARISLPIDGIEIVRGPTKPRAALAHDESIWRMIDHLGVAYQPVGGTDDETGGHDLREWLSLYVDPSDESMLRQVAGIRRLACMPIVERLPEAGPIVFGRGMRIALTVDERAFSGESPYLFGAVLEQFFARYASINSFVQFALHSLQRGALATWRPRIGRRPTL